MSFDPQEVFASVQSFLSSGYVLLAIIALLGVGMLKKIIGLLVSAGIIFLIWFFCQDAIYAAWSDIVGRLSGMIVVMLP